MKREEAYAVHLELCKEEEEPKVEKVIKMRDATPEEQKSVDDYIKNISKPTGADFWDLEQEPCEDCISRQAVLDGLTSIAKAKAKSDAQKSLMGRVMFFTEHLPSVTPKPKTAKWQCVLRGDWIYEQCSSCGLVQDAKSNYCPICGAKMEESEDGKSI